MRPSILVIFLISFLVVQSQVDPAKADSLAKAIEAQQKNTQAYQDSFLKVQDSIYHAGIARSTKDNTNNQPDLISGDQKEKEKYGRQIYLRWGVAALAMVLLVIGLLRWRKSKQS